MKQYIPKNVPASITISGTQDGKWTPLCVSTDHLDDCAIIESLRAEDDVTKGSHNTSRTFIHKHSLFERQ